MDIPEWVYQLIKLGSLSLTAFAITIFAIEWPVAAQVTFDLLVATSIAIIVIVMFSDDMAGR